MNPTCMFSAWRNAVVCLSVAGSLTHLSDARADADKRAPRNDLYVSECGSCHVAFPPGLLPGSSWRSVMSRLDRHFGADASVDAAANSTISAYLQQYAGRKAPPPSTESPRITETAWFSREHRKVAATAWSHATVGTRTNCAGCHTRAETGSYREAEIRIPR